jgi:hypothetical protein
VFWDRGVFWFLDVLSGMIGGALGEWITMRRDKKKKRRDSR